MTEIFSVMLLAWPNAEMFKGGIQKLGPTIELWAACTSDIDFWTAQQAVIKLCKECKFPPSIAEFRERVEKVNSEIDRRVSNAWQAIRMEGMIGDTNQEIYERLAPDNLSRRAIDMIGGPNALSIPMPGGSERWNYEAWERAYRSLLRQQSSLAGASRPAIGGPKQIGGRQK